MDNGKRIFVCTERVQCTYYLYDVMVVRIQISCLNFPVRCRCYANVSLDFVPSLNLNLYLREHANALTVEKYNKFYYPVGYEEFRSYYYDFKTHQNIAFRLMIIKEKRKYETDDAEKTIKI